MPRFFRRLAEGVFDEEDVARRAHDLADFVASAREAYGIAAPVALGFSNGANIAAAVLLLRPEALAGAVLLRAMVPLGAPPLADLAGRRVLILSGDRDPDRSGRERRAAGRHADEGGCGRGPPDASRRPRAVGGRPAGCGRVDAVSGGEYSPPAGQGQGCGHEPSRQFAAGAFGG
jgi:pimeloyl-ACP methyl ester carboxylesterase